MNCKLKQDAMTYLLCLNGENPKIENLKCYHGYGVAVTLSLLMRMQNGTATLENSLKDSTHSYTQQNKDTILMWVF